MSTANHSAASDCFRVLGLSSDASEEEIRARYLHLVKRYPPEHAPQRFQEIRAAYETAKDPLALARQLLLPPGDPQPWEEVIERQKANPPRMTLNFLLSLGNQGNDGPALDEPDGPAPDESGGLQS